MGKGGVVVIGGPRRHNAAEAEEGSAKKMRAEAEEVPVPAAEEVEVAKPKKTKKVMRRLPEDYVEYILAKKPKEPARFPQGKEPKRISEECRLQSARVNELIRATHDHIRNIQEYYRRELDSKGYVEVEDEVEVSDDGF